MVARASEVFVGRARELRELECDLDATRAGSGATILVAGEAGIGKGRLASELAGRARAAGFEILVGRAIDLVGVELPYQPFVEALRPLREPRQVDESRTGSQLHVFENTLALLTDRAAAAPVLLVLEDLHWADTSTLDLTVFLAHNLDGRPVLVLATYHADEPSSAERMERLSDRVRRAGSAVVLELGPLAHEELTALLEAQADAPPPAARLDAIVARAEGNPFFAVELLAAVGDRSGELPRRLRDLLLQRVAGLDRRTQSLLRLASAAGRDVVYTLLSAATELPEQDVRESLRWAVEHGVLVPEQATGSFRFRHALLAEAIYATILPGERDELHANLADQLGRSGAASAAELAPHWEAAGRSTEALTASVVAAREAEAVFGLAEAHAHLERALALWDEVPDAAALTELDLADFELGRGRFDAARAHLDAALLTVRYEPGVATYQGYVAELALWERRWSEADEAVREGIARARPRWGAQIRVWLCAKGLRAQAELAALARVRRDPAALGHRLRRARRLLVSARRAAADASAITPNAAGWLALADAEHERARGVTRAESWADAAAAWDRLQRPPLAAYCHWREGEALVAAGASRPEASVPLRWAHAVAARIGAKPLLREHRRTSHRQSAPHSRRRSDSRAARPRC